MAAAPVEHIFMLESHGAVTSRCNKEFTVPDRLTVVFFYDPTKQDAVVCTSNKIARELCANPPTTDFIFPPNSVCPVDLTLTRFDDIGQQTGILHCQSGTKMSIPGLGPVEPQTVQPGHLQPEICLSGVLASINEFCHSHGIVARIYIFACGQSVDAPIPASQGLAVIPGAYQMSEEQFNYIQYYMKKGKTQDEAVDITDYIMQLSNPAIRAHFDSLVLQSNLDPALAYELTKAGYGIKSGSRTAYANIMNTVPPNYLPILQDYLVRGFPWETALHYTKMARPAGGGRRRLRKRGTRKGRKARRATRRRS